jgi:hypothetical protein
MTPHRLHLVQESEVTNAVASLSMTDHVAEFDAIVEEVQRAGFVTIGKDADVEGEETWTLTATGEQIALRMSMSSEDDAAALLEASS